MAHKLAHDRQEALKILIEEHGAVVVSDVAREWGVSEMTIRRDLKALQDQGVLARVHGGAVAGGALRFRARIAQQQPEKRGATLKLMPFLPHSGAVYLDGSTTIYHLGDQLAKRGGLLVATNNVDTFVRISAYPGIEAVLLGGALNRDTDNLVGPMARRTLSGLSFDAAFFSAYAIHPRSGACEPSPEDAEIKQMVCERSASVFLAMNQGKLGERAAATWNSDPATSTLATELDPDDSRLDPYRELFSQIV
ncbi:MAG: DeoR/GlpR family DNA-binding transcription regulator [Planctomycetota bacterium]|jgi:DeoR family fructose operon transcriptional repressor|nr:DeoR/GlpR family DNA-binding transcription regulator [Planctomycetota bacterium]